jgi:hypothetical protein
MVSSGRRDRPNGVPSKLSICLVENLNSDAEGEPPPPTATQIH